ncbi:unnamed protein product [Zymoseptoria tritici ST99CH_3D1]|nr:unnamed protein product [Zymoseptoria tritici ST99CH_3D1]
MPPGLISSAAPGRKAAPKAAPRRRAQPPVGPPPSAQPAPITTPSVPPQSPPPTQPVTISEPAQEQQPAREASIAQQPQPHPPQSSDPAQEPVVEREQNATIVADALPTPASTQASEQATQIRSEVGPSKDVTSDPPEQRSEAVEEETSEGRSQDPVTQIVPATQQQQQPSSSTTYVPPTSRTAAPATSLPGPPPKRPAVDAPEAATRRPAKKTKRSSARSNATVQAVVQGEEDTTAGAAQEDTTAQAETQPAPKRKAAARRKPAAPRKKKAVVAALSAATVTAGEDVEEGTETAAGAIRTTETDAVGGAEVDDAQPEAEAPAVIKPKKRRKPAKRKVKSAVTVAAEDDGEGAVQTAETQPEVEDDGNESSDPELHEIDPNKVSLWDISHDARHGKMSERGKKMAEINWDKVAQDRRDAANALVANFQREQQLAEDRAAGIEPDAVPSTEDPAATRASQAPGEDNATPAPPPPANDDLGLGFMLDADGNIVADEATLTFTRDAAAQAAAADSAPVEEFNDLTTNINRMTYMNQNRRDPADRLPAWKWKSDPWSEDETDKFYEALRMFGTDFFIISKMFPPKTRRMIKAKFTREEKLDPTRIDAALTGKCTTPMNLEHYSKATGRDVSVFTKYDDLQHVQKVIDEGMKDREVALSADAKRDAKEKEKEAKAKEKEKAKEERKAARKAKSKKAKAGMGGFGGGMGGGGPEEDVAVEAD